MNLKNETEMKNIVGKVQRDTIWIPNLIFDNSVKDLEILNDAFSTLMVNQEKNGTKEMNLHLQKDQRYNGTENSLVYLRTYKIKLLCDFNQHNYPFDYQMCKIKVITFTLQSNITGGLWILRIYLLVSRKEF